MAPADAAYDTAPAPCAEEAAPCAEEVKRVAENIIAAFADQEIGDCAGDVSGAGAGVDEVSGAGAGVDEVSGAGASDACCSKNDFAAEQHHFAVAQNATKARLVFGFNSFLVEFLVFAKASGDEALTKRLKKTHRVVDRMSDEHLVWLSRTIASAADSRYDKLLSDPAAPVRELLDICSGASLSKGVSLSEAWMKTATRGDDWVASLALHARLLVFIAKMFGDLCANANEGANECMRAAPLLDSLFARLVTGVGAATAGEDWSGALTDVIDDDTRTALTCVFSSADECRKLSVGGGTAAAQATEEIRRAGMVAPTRGFDAGGLDEALESLKDSALGKIAMEISESVDKDQLREAMIGEGGGGMEKIVHGMMSGESPGILGDLLEKVSKTVMARMQDGSINIEDLMKDAGSVMGAFGGGAFGGAGGGGFGGAGGPFGSAGLFGGGAGSAAASAAAGGMASGAIGASAGKRSSRRV
jgi:hypothetical protein